MTMTPLLPTYKNNLPNFLFDLREYLHLSQQEAADYFCLDRSRVSRYENHTEKDAPPLGYLAGLIRLAAARADDNGPGIRQSLLREVNEAIGYHYSKGRLQDWETLCGVADNYLAKRQRKYAASPAGVSWRTSLEERLEPPTYTKLFGVEEYLDSLLKVLTAPGPPWLVSIEGLGGIGKTSLADALSRRIISGRLFKDFGWVSARRQIFKLSGEIKPASLPAALTVENLVEKLVAQLMPDIPTPDMLSIRELRALLQTRLKQYPHLIVIDNLETVKDVETLLPTLHNQANPTKFLLTSREHRYESGIYHFPLPELSEASALHLIRHEIELHNLDQLKRASDDDLRKVYTAVGGNPLAIRLVIVQTRIFSLDTTLNHLSKAQCKTVKELYTFIYRRAWESLDEPTRNLFVLMPLIIDEGESLEDLVKSSGLDPAAVHTSLKYLVELNLVNSSGDHNRRRYGLHSLTRTFLQEEVLKVLTWT